MCVKISLIQCSIEWLQPSINRSAAEEWIAKCSDSSLIVFPEMFTTGFCMQPKQSAESDKQTLRWMVDMAKKHNTAIAGSVAVEESGEYYNRLYVVQSDGSYVKYDKRHLFTFAGEDRSYKAGGDRVVVEVGEVSILLLICYDLRFPVWSRNRGDYDLMLCVANWPTSRRGAWDMLLRARAIENLCYVCGVNIVGGDYSGGTVAIDYIGREVSSVADDECGVATFEVDMEALRRFRGKFPALDDADDFEIMN